VAAKSLEFSNKEDSRPVKLFFQDEARFGRIDNVSSCWVPCGCRALVGKQIIRQYTYLYGAFCPQTGEQFCMILPYSNSDCMNIFLSECSNQFADYKIIMGMDNASWHAREKSKNIDNIVPLFQPPYSPEVNPAENIWRHIRTNGGFKNTTFSTIKEVEECLCRAVNNLFIRQKNSKINHRI
jgi:hypothetical protein